MSDAVEIRTITTQDIEVGDIDKFNQIALLQAHLVYQSLMTEASTTSNDELKRLIQRYSEKSPQLLEELRERITEINLYLKYQSLMTEASTTSNDKLKQLIQQYSGKPLQSLEELRERIKEILYLKLNPKNQKGTVRINPTAGGTGYQYTTTEAEMMNIIKTIYQDKPTNSFVLFFDIPTDGKSYATESGNIPAEIQLQQIRKEPEPFANFAIAKHLLHPLLNKRVGPARIVILSVLKKLSPDKRVDEFLSQPLLNLLSSDKATKEILSKKVSELESKPKTVEEVLKDKLLNLDIDPVKEILKPILDLLSSDEAIKEILSKEVSELESKPKTVKEVLELLLSKLKINKLDNYGFCYNFLESELKGKAEFKLIKIKLQKIVETGGLLELVDAGGLLNILMDIFIQDTVDFLKTKGIEVESTDTGLNPEDLLKKLDSYTGEDKAEVKKLVELMASYFVAHESIFEKSLPKPEPELEPKTEPEPEPELEPEQAKIEEFEAKPLHVAKHIVIKEEQPYVAELVESQKVVVEEMQKPQRAKGIKLEQSHTVYLPEPQQPETKKPLIVNLPESSANGPTSHTPNTIFLPEPSEQLTTRGVVEPQLINIDFFEQDDKTHKYRGLPYVGILALWCISIPGFAFLLTPLQILLGLLANKTVKKQFEELGSGPTMKITDENGQPITIEAGELINCIQGGAVRINKIFINGLALADHLKELTEQKKQSIISELCQDLSPEIAQVVKQRCNELIKPIEPNTDTKQQPPVEEFTANVLEERKSTVEPVAVDGSKKYQDRQFYRKGARRMKINSRAGSSRW